MLNTCEIENELKKIGITPPKIIYYDSTDSTNTRAKEYAESNPENRDTVIFIADEQTAGRGRRGRSFVSNKGSGIFISILSYPDENGFDATATTAEAAVRLAQAIEDECDCKTQIKWVNDIFLGKRKLCGILTEGKMESDGKIGYQIVGMGINVYKNAISDEISHIATSLESELNHAPNRSKLVARIIKEFLTGGEDFYNEYKARSFIIGKNVTVIRLNESYEAKVLDINEDYSLLVERDGKTERLFTGEISLKI